MSDFRPDYLTRDREVYALESKASHETEWVVEDFFSAADLAEEQRVWMAGKYPTVTFRLWRYLPEETPCMSADSTRKDSGK